MTPSDRYLLGLSLLIVGFVAGAHLGSETTMKAFAGALVSYCGIWAMVALRARLERALLGRRRSSDWQLCWSESRAALAAVFVPALLGAALSQDPGTSAYFAGVALGAAAIALLFSKDPPEPPRRKRRSRHAVDFGWRFGLRSLRAAR